MRLLARIVALFLYCFVMFIVLGNKIENILSIKDLSLLCIGTVIFTIFSLVENKKPLNKSILKKVIRKNFLFAGTYSAVILLFLNFSTINSVCEIELASKNGLLIQMMFSQLRPFMYSIIIYILLFDFEDIIKRKETDSGHSTTNEFIITLSKREKEIVFYISKDLSNKEISNILHISPFTVKKHVYNIFTKLHINQRAEIKYIIRELELEKNKP